MLSPLGAAFPALDAHALLAEVRDRVLEELDLEGEAAVQRRFHRALRGHPMLVVPAPVTRLAGERVTVSEWVDGVTLAHASAPDRAAARLLLFTLGGAVAGMVHADPDPDDVRVLGDGRLAVLDFGAWGEVDPDRVGHVRAAVSAFASDDARRFGVALHRLGWPATGHGRAALDLIRHALGELAGPGPARLDSAALAGLVDRLRERCDDTVAFALGFALPPGDLWPMRGVGQLFATIARVGATGDWRRLVELVLRDGWRAPIED